MKKNINYTMFLFLLIVYSCSSNLSNFNESNYYYRSALNFIKYDSTAIKFIAGQSTFSGSLSYLKISVSPKIFPPNLAEFGSTAIKNKLSFELNDRNFNYNNSISDSLIKYENYLFYEPYIKNEVGSLTLEDNTNAIIFFSKVYDNFLTAMLFYRDEKLSITEIPKFQASLNYLIIFKDKEINKVLRQAMSP